MRISHLITILVLLAAGLLPSPVHAGGVVAVCDEAHLLAALAGGGTVTFACSGVITLSNTITIAANTTIDGSGQSVTISGNGAVRVFTVNAGATLNLNKLTVAHGSSAYDTGGGGISNDGTLNLNNVSFSGNSGGYDGGGGAIYNNAGTVTVSQCVFSDNSAPGPGGGGGAIKNEGVMTVSGSGFFANGAPSSTGGGIYNSGTLTVTNSTFSGNSAATAGGIFNSVTLIVSNSTLSDNSAVSQGGGIYTYYGALTVSNSTFSGNSAMDGGGMGSYGGTVTVSNSTLAGNSATYGGGISRGYDSTVTLSNTIVANSPSGGNCYGVLTDGGGNLSYPDTTCPGINADPKLGPLQHTGGATWAMPLRLGSAALDAGDDAVCAAPPVNGLDQRGFIRPAGSHCDIGAVEQRLVTACDEAHLREMVAVGGTVNFACSGVITLTNTITIDADTTIDGSGQTVTISGGYGVRLLDVAAGVTLSLNRLTIANGGCDPGCHGGGIRNNGGAVTVSTCAFHGNTAHFSVGGAIWNSQDGILTVVDSTFDNNGAVRGAGGAIFNNGGAVTVSGSRFHDNNAGGGAIASWGGVLAVNNSTFDHNSAEGGGGIHNLRGTATIGNSTFSNNVANRSSGSTGAGIYNGEGGALNIWNSTFSGNWAGYGGGVGNAGGTVLVSNSTFDGNRAFHGGGIGGEAILRNSIVANSIAGENCSGAITDGGGNLSYPDTTCPGINADPLLGPLQDNGGPTWTMALGPGSAAMDAGDDAVCAAPPVNNRDQRGVVRPQGARCDSGALEQLRRWLPMLVVTTSP